MRALLAEAFDAELGRLRVATVPDPRLDKGEVLVRVSLSPVNPADVLMLQGRYIRDTRPPFVPGVVGVGRVLDHRAGPMGAFLKGRRVVFAATRDKPGAWAELTQAPAALCLPLPSRLADTDGANLLSNAATALALLDTLRQARVRAVVVTAAAGEVGRLLLAAAPRYGIRVVAVVRREEQAARLEGAGAAAVLVSSQATFAADLRKHAIAERVTAAVDAVGGGAVAAQVIDALPPGSTFWALGELGDEPIRVEAMRHLIGRGIVLRGFAIDAWFPRQSLPKQLATARAAQRLLVDRGPAPVQHRLSLEQAAGGLRAATRSTTAGKTLIYPNGVPSR